MNVIYERPQSQKQLKYLLSLVEKKSFKYTNHHDRQITWSWARREKKIFGNIVKKSRRVSQNVVQSDSIVQEREKLINMRQKT